MLALSSETMSIELTVYSSPQAASSIFQDCSPLSPSRWQIFLCDSFLQGGKVLFFYMYYTFFYMQYTFIVLYYHLVLTIHNNNKYIGSLAFCCLGGNSSKKWRSQSLLPGDIHWRVLWGRSGTAC